MSRILKLKNKMNMKNLIKYGFIAVVSCFLLACNSNNFDEDVNSKGNYHNLSKLLNECECYAVVVAKAHDDGYLSGYDDFLIIMDGKKKTFTYQGSEYNVSKGDTLIVKPNCN